MPRLNDKLTLITGAARGIGAAIATIFIAEGARVLLTDRDDTLGEPTSAALGERAVYRHLDVREEADWAAALDWVMERWGRLDVLVNNAGITGFEPGTDGSTGPQDPEHVTLADWHAVHRTNLDGVFLGCQTAIRAMRLAGRGSIINISSRSGQVGIAGAAAYASSKAAVRNHTKSVALYCAEQGLAIRCNSIHPGAILTPMWEPVLGQGPAREERLREFVWDTPLRRFGTPAEVAAVALLLATDEAAYMTGSELTIDGGILAGSPATPRPGAG